MTIAGFGLRGLLATALATGLAVLGAGLLAAGPWVGYPGLAMLGAVLLAAAVGFLAVMQAFTLRRLGLLRGRIAGGGDGLEAGMAELRDAMTRFAREGAERDESRLAHLEHALSETHGAFDNHHARLTLLEREGVDVLGVSLRAEERAAGVERLAQAVTAALAALDAELRARLGEVWDNAASDDARLLALEERAEVERRRAEVALARHEASEAALAELKGLREAVSREVEDAIAARAAEARGVVEEAVAEAARASAGAEPRMRQAPSSPADPLSPRLDLLVDMVTSLKLGLDDLRRDGDRP